MLSQSKLMELRELLELIEPREPKELMDEVLNVYVEREVV